MKKIEAKIVADSVSPQGHRITSFILTYPRFIHSELMTHRMFSRNSASSRAIPFEKMVKMVEEDPFIPIAWQKDHKGMQGSDYIETEDGLYVSIRYWLEARDRAIKKAAQDLHSCNITKQLCNRLLEPFMWHTVLVTATEYDNFFELRCPQYNYKDEYGELLFKSKKDYISFYNYKDSKKESILPNSELEWIKFSKSGAEIHIQALAESMWDAYNESTPKKLQPGEWHIPFEDNIDISGTYGWNKTFTEQEMIKVKIATARCARLSYMTFDGVIDYEKDLELHDKLLESKHLSPMEHCAMCKNDNIWYANFKGWQSYRYLIEND